MMWRVSGLLALSILAACFKPETVSPPSITVSGPTSVAVATSITLSAATANGHDTSYTWSSDAADVATVDAAGNVTALALGEADIHVTGDQSHATTVHPVVVVAADTSSVPNYDAWLASPHADASATAFAIWSTDEFNGTIPVTCARCHSSGGYVDYLGGDGTPAGVVDAPQPAGSVVDCKTCHTAAAQTLSDVTFPSGTTVSGLGPEARCMVCHQGRASGHDVDTGIAKAALASDDTVSSALSFTSIHYAAAAASLEGGRTASGYQYVGNAYDVRFRHVPGVDNCVACHDAHSTAVKLDVCVTCHTAVTDNASLRTIRMMSSATLDYDGDGNLSEGIAGEVEGVQAQLLVAIQRYGAERGSQPCYSSGYPYWFVDANANGSCDAGETTSYASWTPRLVRAAYNYQFAGNDLGGFAHNAKYIIELLYDAIADLDSALSQPVDMSRLVRTDYGHFDGTDLPAREWDTSASGIPAACSRCHSGSVGFHFFTQYGVGTAVAEQGNGLDCATCHATFAPDYSLGVPALVYLADGKTTTFGNTDNLCANCHIGRQNGATIEAAIAAAPPSGVASFQNVHYLLAAGTRGGSTLGVGSQVADLASPGSPTHYAGALTHVGGVDCTTCHDPVATKHTFAIADVWPSRCTICHGDASGPQDIRGPQHTADYDGDGNVSESIASELAGVGPKLLDAMRAYAVANTLAAVPCYTPDTNPYFFKDSGGNDATPTCTSAEAVSANVYKPWPAKLLRAGHNYQISQKDPGAYAHNFDYVDQLLFDSIEDLGGSTAGMSRAP